LPVGNSDRGVGLGAGEILIFADFAYQNFDWWHDVVPDAIIPGTDDPENFEHLGLLKNKSMNLGFTIGLNDWWNITLSTLLSERCMVWEGPVDPDGNSLTVHHRTECSSTDFKDNGEIKAFGGFLGDTKINAKYLLYNVGKGTGPRLFLGGGLIIPSSNELTESPWIKTDHDNDSETPDRYNPHRHFYLSDGAYKAFAEFQFFMKRAKFPVFWGTAIGFETPLGESDYGFKPSNKTDVTILALSGPFKHLEAEANSFRITSIGFNFTISHVGGSEWDGVRTPNSEATAYIPGISILFASKAGTFGLNFQKGYESYSMKTEYDIKEETDIYAISLSYRRLLDKVIEGLYW